MRQVLSAVFLLFAFSFGFSQTYPYKQVIEELCTNAYSGRGYVDNGAQKTAAFIAKEFQKIGLKPIQKKSYYQHFTFPVQTFPGKCQLIIGKVTLVPGIDFIVDPASAGIPNQKSYQLVYCNEKTLYKSISGFTPCPIDRMLVVRTSGFGGDTNKIMKGRLNELKQYAAVLEITEQKLTWSVSQTTLQYPSIIAKAELFRELPKMATLSLESTFIKKNKSSNVIGFLPATSAAQDKPYIVLTAHYDHLGRMGKDTYFPGANDNASGIGMLLLLANELKNQRNSNYNYVFIAFGGEEVGLIGSSYFVENPLIPLEQIRFLLNTDIMGSGEDGITVVNATLFNDAFEKLVSLNRAGAYITQVKSRGPAANSDHYFFTEKGVPSFFVYTMGPNKNYHDVFDKYEALSFSAFEPLAKLLYEFLNSF